MGAFTSTPPKPDQVSGKRNRSGNEDQTDSRPNKKACLDSIPEGPRTITIMQHAKLEAENTIEYTPVTEADIEDSSPVATTESTVDSMTQEKDGKDSTGIVMELQEFRDDIKISHDILDAVIKWLDCGGVDDEGQFANAEKEQTFAHVLSLIKVDLLSAAELAHDIVEKNCSIAAAS